jgi:hypothetical protein
MVAEYSATKHQKVTAKGKMKMSEFLTKVYLFVFIGLDLLYGYAEYRWVS